MRNYLEHLQRKYALARRRHVRTVKRHAKKPFFAIPVVTFMVSLALVTIAWIVLSGGKPQLQPDDDTNIVMINHDKQERTVPTQAKTVGQLLQRLEIKLNEGDVVEPAKDTEIIGDNFRVNVYRAVPVTIVDGADKTFTYSAAATPRSIVRQAGITVYPEDNLSLKPTENFVTESSIGERVVIKRATPVTVNLYGTQVAMRTHATTIKQLLKEKHINLGKDDDVQPSLDAAVTADSQIFLIRKGTQIATQEVPIDMPVETVEDKSLTFGTTVVRQQGAPGKKLVTYQVELQNGVEIGRKIIQEVVAQEAVKQVVAKGVYFDIAANKTSVMAAAGLKPGDYQYADYIISRESGWCHTKWQGQYGGCPAYHGTPTASGTGYGLCQATPASKMASAGADWGSNPVTQMKWCHGYAMGRYGSWSAAYNHWTTKHWW
ncbi:MAG TPA: ubiquitin-like domain-containing protein [Candidatus Saccharimonadales bacterium]|nr:ubiquitin-like domain-containing protein [Candidatus Saccharimonadales bacterium]